MKNFFKKLAFVLALAMVVTAFAPAAQASAAKAPVLNTTGKKLYLGGDETGKYSEKFTLKVWNKGNYSVTFASDNTAVATVSKWYGVVEAKAVGTATITATVSNKETKKVVKTLSAKVYVKLNADSVAFGSLAKFDQPLVVGDKVKINVARKAGDVTAWKQADKSQITDYVVWTSSNTEVAKVDKWGTVTAVAPGEATISAVATQIEDKVATTEAATVKVTVVAKGITEITQTTTNQIKVKFGAAQDTEKVTKDTLTITSADVTKATPIVKEVKFDDAKTEATVTVYVNFDDKAVYTVAVKDTDSKKDFVASVGDVASVTITKPATVVVGVETVIEYDLKDANGVVLADDHDKITVEFVDGAINAYPSRNADGHTITIYEKGKTATVQLVYHTYEYDTEGNEKVFKSNAFVITGIDAKDSTLGTTKFTVATGSFSDVGFGGDYKKNSQITLENFDYKIHVEAKDSVGNTYKTDSNVSSKFKFESMDKNIVEVDSEGKLYPVAKGTGHIKVTVIDIDKSFVVQVVVVDKAKPAQLIFDKATATVTEVEGNVIFKTTVKDQYGNLLNTATNPSTFDIVTGLNNTPEDAGLVFVNTNRNIEFNVALATTLLGTKSSQAYTFKITVGDITRNLTVIVKKADDVVTRLSVEISSTTVDMARNNENNGEEVVAVTVYGLDKNGLKAKVYTPDSDYSVSFVDKKGNIVSSTNTYKVVAVSGSSLLVKANETGNYTVTVKTLKDIEDINNKVIVKGNVTLVQRGFSVSDSQIKPVVSVNSTTIDVNKIYADQIKDAFSVSTKNNSNSVAIKSVKGYEIGVSTASNPINNFTSGRYVITKVLVEETFEGGNTLIHEIDVNKTFTFK